MQNVFKKMLAQFSSFFLKGYYAMSTLEIDIQLQFPELNYKHGH